MEISGKNRQRVNSGRNRGFAIFSSIRPSTMT